MGIFRRLGTTLTVGSMLFAGTTLGGSAPQAVAADPPAAGAPASLGAPTLVSYSTDGDQPDDVSDDGQLTNDGQDVFFDSMADNVDNHHAPGIFERDIATGVTTRVSVDQTGAFLKVSEDDLPINSWAVSDSGQDLVFNAYTPDTTCGSSVFYKDLTTGALTSLTDSCSFAALTISANGRYVVYELRDPGVNVHTNTLYLYDAVANTTTDLNTSVAGISTADGYSALAISPNGHVLSYVDRDEGYALQLVDLQSDTMIPFTTPAGDPIKSTYDANQPFSADGRYFVFSTKQGKIVPHDTNGNVDVFVYDISAQTFERETVTSGGGQAFGQFGTISPDGRYVAFTSYNDPALPPDGAGQYYIRDRQTGDVVANYVTEDWGTKLRFADVASGLAVAFTTLTPLVPDDLNSQPDIYVAPLNGATVDAPAADAADRQIAMSWPASRHASHAASAATHFVRKVEVRIKKGPYAPSGVKGGRLLYEGTATRAVARHLKNATLYAVAIFRFTASGKVASRQVLAAKPVRPARTSVSFRKPHPAQVGHRIHIKAALSLGKPASSPLAGQRVRLLERPAGARAFHRVASGKTQFRGHANLNFTLHHTTARHIALRVLYPGNVHYAASSRTVVIAVLATR